MSDRSISRRRFLEFVAASPLFAGAAPLGAADVTLPKQRPADPLAWMPHDPGVLIKDPKEAISVFDFEPVARQNIPVSHFGYMTSGVGDEVTLRANREGFAKFQLRPRRLVDVSKVDMGVDIFGTRYSCPIGLAPVGYHRAFHPEGELATARGAKAGNHLMIVSNQMTTPIEEINAARGTPVWFQLYASNKWEIARPMVARAQKAGCPVVAVTVDIMGGRIQDTQQRFAIADTRVCTNCHDRTTPQGNYRRRSMYDGIDITGIGSSTNMTWDFFKRLRDATTMKIVVKGLLAHEDARIAADLGLDGIIVSNHGGRSEDSGRSTIDALPEMIEAVGGRIPVFVDSGFRRGVDIVKALAMGAQAVCVGRPYIWGLGAFGEPGVERVLQLLRIELGLAMQQMGAPTVKQLTPAMVRRA